MLDQSSEILQKAKWTPRDEQGLTVFESPTDRQPPVSFTITDDDVLAYGSNPDALRETIAVLHRGREDSLDRNPRFQAFRDKAEGIGDLEFACSKAYAHHRVGTNLGIERLGIE